MDRLDRLVARASMPRLGWAAVALGALFAAQVLVGAATVWSGFADALRGLHLSMATFVWAALVFVAGFNFKPRFTAVGAPKPVPGPVSSLEGVAT